MSVGNEMTFRHRWVLRVGREEKVSEGARLMGIMAINEFGKSHRGAEFWPSHQKLAELIGVSERTAERRMNELAKAGLIEKRSTGGRTSNRYVAILPNPDSRDGVTPTGVTGEQTHEQIHHEQIHHEQIHLERIHLERIHLERIHFPCFTCGKVECLCDEEAQDSETPSGISAQVAAASGGEAAEVEMCEFHMSFPSEGCPECLRPKIVSKQTEWKQIQRHHRELEAEGLNSMGYANTEGEAPRLSWLHSRSRY